MKNTNNTFLLIMLIVILAGGAYIFFQIRDAIPQLPTIPTINLPTADLRTNTPGPDVVYDSATQLAESGHPLPTQVVNYWQQGDIIGLLGFYSSLDTDIVSISTNIHTLETTGIGEASEIAYNWYCNMVWPMNKLCKTATIKWGSVYRGNIIGGVNDIPTPMFSFKGDWEETSRTETDNQLDIYSQSTVIVTYNLMMCVTAVEERTPSLINTGEEIPDDTSYWILLQDDRLLPDIGPYKHDMDVNEEALRTQAYKIAKTNALLPEKVQELYSLLRIDLAPDGEFFKKIEAIYTDEVATLFKVKGFEIVINVTEEDPRVRCDQTNVNK